jgi:hypothetical protein
MPAVVPSIDETEAARVDLSEVDVELPAWHPGPAPAASRPLADDAKMSTLEESGESSPS